MVIVLHAPLTTVSTEARRERLSAALFTVALLLSLWVALGSLVLAVADDLGSHPLRRVLIGLLLVVVSAWALWQRTAVCAALRAWPWLVVVIAAAQLGAAALDGLLAGGIYRAFSMTSIALAVAVARPRTVWLTTALLSIGYAGAIFSGHSPAALARSGQLDGVVGALLGYPFVALVLLGLTRLFARFMASADRVLVAMHDGAPALTPALQRALQAGPQRPLALPPAPAVALTGAERRVVAGLASGRAPKELAHRWGISVGTVRTHIKHAKRKTGARTINELVAVAARLDRPEADDDG
jgi:DNA-binding CsgD family transcriptional regulator